jgi:diazepam-binding inhibitor (GABA receptor modulator, acyl-CoA-binding protein)
MSLKEVFEEATVVSKLLPAKPDNQTLLRLYSLYKQATEGDLGAAVPQPGPFDFVAKAKYGAWEALQGMSMEEAMNAYIEQIQTLKNR